MEVLLHNIRSVYNIGSMFRTADAAGVNKIHLGGYSATPIDRFGRKRQDLHKAALGAEDAVAWESYDDVYDHIIKLKRQGCTVIGVEQDERSVDYRTIANLEHILLIMGNEVDGIEPKILDLCDHIAEIPMHGSKKSLNVSVAFGIVAYAFSTLS